MNAILPIDPPPWMVSAMWRGPFKFYKGDDCRITLLAADLVFWVFDAKL